MYEDTISSGTGGCDTILLVDVMEEVTPKNDTIYVELAPGEVYYYKDSAYTSIGVYTIQSPSQSVCDSVITISISLKVEETIDKFLYIPTVFSPNGDGQNDALAIHSPEPLSDFTIKVYDRYGQKVWQSSTSSEEWDGRHQGQAATSGVYVVKVDYVIQGDTRQRSKVEAVTIVR